MKTEEELFGLFGELHQQEEGALYGKEHKRQSDFEKQHICHCGTSWDGIECTSCGFDATKLD